MSVDKPPARLPRWLIPVVIFVAVLAVVSGLAARQWYAPDQTGQSVGPSTSAGTSPTGKEGELTVNFAEDATGHPLSGQIRTLLQAYFTAINAGNYDQWRTLVTAKAAAQNSQSQWSAAYATSRDSDVRVYRINTTNSDGIVVLLSFTSRQDLAHAPTQAPSTCDKWSLALPLKWERNALKVDLGSANSTPEVQACGG